MMIDVMTIDLQWSVENVLFNSFVQGFLVTALLMLVLRITPNASATQRHSLILCVFSILALLPVANAIDAIRMMNMKLSSSSTASTYETNKENAIGSSVSGALPTDLRPLTTQDLPTSLGDMPRNRVHETKWEEVATHQPEINGPIAGDNHAPKAIPNNFDRSAQDSNHALFVVNQTITPYALLGVWLTGFIVCVFKLLREFVIAFRLKKMASPVSTEAMQILLTHCKSSYKLRCRVNVLEHPNVVPTCLPGRTPTIVLPTDWRNWPESKTKSVLLHELGHIQRKDIANGCLAYAVSAIYWLNPLVWLTMRRLCEVRELACDAMVLSNGVRPSAYAEHLISFVQCSDRRTVLPSFRSRSLSQLKNRLETILNPQRPNNVIPLSKLALLSISTISVAIWWVIPKTVFSYEQVASPTNSVGEPVLAKVSTEERSYPKTTNGAPKTQAVAANTEKQQPSKFSAQFLDMKSGAPSVGIQVAFTRVETSESEDGRTRTEEVTAAKLTTDNKGTINIENLTPGLYFLSFDVFHDNQDLADERVVAITKNFSRWKSIQANDKSMNGFLAENSTKDSILNKLYFEIGEAALKVQIEIEKTASLPTEVNSELSNPKPSAWAVITCDESGQPVSVSLQDQLEELYYPETISGDASINVFRIDQEPSVFLTTGKFDASNLQSHAKYQLQALPTFRLAGKLPGSAKSYTVYAKMIHATYNNPSLTSFLLDNPVQVAANSESEFEFLNLLPGKYIVYYDEHSNQLVPNIVASEMLVEVGEGQPLENVVPIERSTLFQPSQITVVDSQNRPLRNRELLLSSEKSVYLEKSSLSTLFQEGTSRSLLGWDAIRTDESGCIEFDFYRSTTFTIYNPIDQSHGTLSVESPKSAVVQLKLNSPVRVFIDPQKIKSTKGYHSSKHEGDGNFLFNYTLFRILNNRLDLITQEFYVGLGSNDNKSIDLSLPPGDYEIKFHSSNGLFKPKRRLFTVGDSTSEASSQSIDIAFEPGDFFDLIDQPAPELRDIHHWALDNPTSLSQLKGKVVLLKIGSFDRDSWLPDLDRILRHFTPNEFEIVMVDASGIMETEDWIRENRSAVRAASAIRANLDFEGPYFSTGADYRVIKGALFLIDREGIVRSVWHDKDLALENAIQELIDQ